MAESKTTTDRQTIRDWAEERGGKPATIKQTESRGGEPGVLRIHFPGYSDEEEFNEITWETFFDAFDENDLAMVYQEETDDGGESRFYKFVRRDKD